MKMEFEYEKETLHAEFRVTSSEIEIERDGKKRTFKFLKTPSGYQLIGEEKIYDVTVRYSSHEELQLYVNNHFIPVRWIERRKYQYFRKSSPDAGHAEVRSLMPGRVSKILVEEGQFVKLGQSIIVVEAMKMENELKARVEGKIKSIHVQAGDSVEGGALLVTIDEA